MAFFNKADKKKKFDRFQKKSDDDEVSSSKKKFDNKPAPSDEEDDDQRNQFNKKDDKGDDQKGRNKFSKFRDKFKKGENDKFNDKDKEDEEDDEDEDDKKKGVGWQNATKDNDQDTDDTESTSVDKKRGEDDDEDEVSDDEEESNGKSGKCNCKRQIEINPPLRTQSEAIMALPVPLQADAIAALAKQETEKILSSLCEKAEKHGIGYDILFEVFRRGWFSGRGSDHLTEAEIGFNRVNSFLAGGLARRLDEDLVMEAKKDQGVWQSGKTEYYTRAGKNKDSAQSRIDRSWSARGEDGKTFHGFGTKRQALQTKQQYDAWCKRGKTGYMNDPIKEDMGINTPSDDMVCDHDEPTPGEKLKNRLRKKRK